MLNNYYFQFIYAQCNDSNKLNINDDQLQVVAAITLFTCGFSILASFSIISAILYRYKCCMVSIYQLLNIALADFIASTLLIVSIILHFAEANVSLTCQFLSVASLTLFLSSFVFLVLYAAQAYVGTLKLRKGRVLKFFEPEYRFNIFRLLYIIGWFVPITVSSIAYYKFTHIPDDILQRCFTCVPLMHFRNLHCRDIDLYDKWIKQSILFLVPGVLAGLLLILFLCGHLYEYSLWYKQNTITVMESNKQKEEIQRKKSVVFYFVFSFVFCWLPCFLILGLGENMSVCNTYPLYIIQAFTAPLHGLMNSLVYGWQRKSIRHLLLNKQSESINSSDFTAQLTISQNDISSMFMYTCSDDDEFVVINNHNENNSDYGSIFHNDEETPNILISKHGDVVKGTEKHLYG